MPIDMAVYAGVLVASGVALMVMGWLAGALYAGRKRIDDLHYLREVSDEQWSEMCGLLGDLSIVLARDRCGPVDATPAPEVIPDVASPEAGPKPEAAAFAAPPEPESPTVHLSADVAADADLVPLADRIYKSIFGDPPPDKAAANIKAFQEHSEEIRRASEEARLEGEESARSIRREDRERLGETASSALRRASRASGPGKLSVSMVGVMRLLADGEVHSADDIVKAVPGISTAASAATSISLLRNKVKDRAITIETVRGRGYRISEVTIQAARDLLSSLTPAAAQA